MIRRPNQKYKVELSDEERKKIESVIRNKNVSRTIKCRAQILKLIGGPRDLTQKQISHQVGVTASTVSKTVKQYAEEGIDSVLKWKHNPASDAARIKADGEAEARLLALACSAPPEGFSRWTLNLLTEKSAKILEQPLSRATIQRILKRNRLQPHRSRYWNAPPDEDAPEDKRRLYGKKLDRVIETYQQPYDPKVVLVNLDEKVVNLHREVRPVREAIPNHPRKVDSEYERCGTANIFVIVEPHTGRNAALVRKRRTALDFAETIDYIATKMYPDAETIKIVMDNLSTHTIGSLYKRFSEEKARRLAERLEFIFTPPHASWANVAENQISIISRQCLTKRVPDIETLRKTMRFWVRHRNQNLKPVQWHFTKKDARVKLRHLYPDDDAQTEAA